MIGWPPTQPDGLRVDAWQVRTRGHHLTTSTFTLSRYTATADVCSTVGGVDPTELRRPATVRRIGSRCPAESARRNSLWRQNGPT
ncbi:hypothetical protein MICRO80W_10034 [Micrococcus luteus]|nr:hypothetical protein MICRO80W_10034 [Micrococcus luteus]